MTETVSRGRIEGGRKRPIGPLEATLTSVALIALVLFMVYPVCLVLWSAFRPGGIAGSTAALFTLANFAKILDAGFYLFIVNSLFVCVGAVFFGTLLSIAAAYALSRLPLPFRQLIQGCLMVGQFFPWIVLITPLFILFARLGLTNNLLVMIFCYTAVVLPFSIYMLTGYVESIPKSLDEAAIIDGASVAQVIRHVIVPLLWPGIVATATYSFLQCWAEYLLALAFLTSPEAKTIPLGVYQFFGDDRIDWGAVMAASAVATVPALLLFLPLQRRLAAGLTAGAVK